MKTKKKKERRSDIKIMTPEARVLKHLRESRKLSMRKASKIIGLSSTYVNHAENGRLDLNKEVIFKFLVSYGYSYEDFLKIKEGTLELPENTLYECVEILKRLSPAKLKTVKVVLESF